MGVAIPLAITFGVIVIIALQTLPLDMLHQLSQENGTSNKNQGTGPIGTPTYQGWAAVTIGSYKS